MRDEDREVVSALRLFTSCRDETRTGLLRGSFLQRFPPEVVLIREGEPADFMCVLVEGRVELFASANGRRTTLSVAEPPTTLVLAAILTDGVYLQSGRTLEASRVLLIPADNVRAALGSDAGFAAAIAGEVALRYRELVRDAKDIRLRSGVERLANYLLRHARPSGGKKLVELDIEKRLLASRLGITPENLSRAFASLAAYGVTTRGARIEIGDEPALLRLARPTPLIDGPTE